MRYIKTFEKKFGHIAGDYVKYKRDNEFYIIDDVDYLDSVFPYKIRNIKTNNVIWTSPDEVKKLNKFELQIIKYNL